MMKLMSMAAGLALIAGAASAAPVALSDANMDAVTAGYHYANADATANALAFGLYTRTNAEAYTFSVVTPYSSESGASSRSTAAAN